VILNANSSKIQEPGTLEDLGADLLNAVTSQGTVQTGVALKVGGRAFGVGRDWVDYRSSYWTRFLARASVSLATAQDPTTPSTALGSLGLRLVLYDGTDPLVDPELLARVNNVEKACPTPSSAEEADAFKACVAKLKLQPLAPPPWNADGASIAAATSDAFSNGALGRGRWADTAVWLTGSAGISTWLQLSAAAEYRHADIADKNIFAASGRVRGGSSTIRGSLEATYLTDNPADQYNRKGRLLVGLDIKMATGTWLNANIGGDCDFAGSPFSVFSLASLKYAFAAAPAVPQ
jgi:hypothetical protein